MFVLNVGDVDINKNPSAQDVEMAIMNYKEDDDFIILDISGEGDDAGFIQTFMDEQGGFSVEYHKNRLDVFQTKQSVGRAQVIKFFLEFFNNKNIKIEASLWDQVDVPMIANNVLAIDPYADGYKTRNQKSAFLVVFIILAVVGIMVAAIALGIIE
ncbi:MAG: hypothetical protein COU31_02540 [Candidatus Magasanikbacteria bacterium CG10_big_fil_rev_8_21_14_0_10_40_10]|uniref:Uncharacterized protein n=1 Tax=Candidatus Magasanikbacteria bacterium CG10_big_fil_rev_8_21_14_0_10_40_10 TaxID=1974648 RepID=A0A2M6W418_9BACT|nr:MAG: hypothetical protein COU31_02540 [Candidatus Magasanikbacteria bacterium CG10_big_fil_rev_8_21_14_0_10_40_10]